MYIMQSIQHQGCSVQNRSAIPTIRSNAVYRLQMNETIIII